MEELTAIDGGNADARLLADLDRFDGEMTAMSQAIFHNWHTMACQVLGE